MTDAVPPGWVSADFGDVLDFKGGSQPPKSKFSEELKPGYIRLLQIRDFESDERAVYIRDQANWPKCTYTDIMLGRYGASVGKVLSGKAGAYNVALVRMIFPEAQIEHGWVRYYLKSAIFQEPLARLSRSAQNGFNKGDLVRFPFPVPPLNEQRRIVAKIEALMARSARAKEALDDIPALLDRYRQSVLAAAFRGDLTADWRKRHAHTEPINRAQDESFDQHQQKQNPKFDRFQLPHLPATWSYENIDKLITRDRAGMKTGPFGTLLKKADHRPAGVPVLGIENISPRGFVPGAKIKISEEKAAELSSYDVRPGDILISRSGTVGEVCIAPHDVGDARFSTNLMRLSLREDIILPEVFRFMFKGCASVLRQVSELCSGSTRDFLNQEILRIISFPVSPLLEQHAMLKNIDSAYYWCNAVEEAVQEATASIPRLNQSILAKAFRGELVPQDPNDEPASALLARIKAERDANGTPARRGRRGNRHQPQLAGL